MTAIKLISPVDGSVYAERTPLAPDAARSMAARAKVAQKGWAARPLEERIALVKAGVAKLRVLTEKAGRDPKAVTVADKFYLRVRPKVLLHAKKVIRVNS